MNKPKYFQKDRSVKSIDLTAKEWFDKGAGNSYFSLRIIVNEGLKNCFIIRLPFQYGYGSYYEQAANETLIEMGVISENMHSSRRYEITKQKMEKCGINEVKRFGKVD